MADPLSPESHTGPRIIRSFSLFLCPSHTCSGCAAVRRIPSPVSYRILNNGQTDIPKEKLVVVLRILNTAEYSYRQGTGRFAQLEEMLTFLRKKGTLSQLPIDLENPKPYELTITTNPNGMHYQITLQRPSDMNDKTTWCKTAAFSDDRGVIFLGSAIGCEASTQ